MKKTIKTIICIALFSCLLISLLSACSSKMLTGDDYIKVHSITYSHGNSTNLTSSYYFEYTIEEVDVTEYENSMAITDLYYTSGTIGVDGLVDDNQHPNARDKHTPEQLKKFVGKTYYSTHGNYPDKYVKITYTDLHISYLNVKFINDDTFEVSYYSNLYEETITKRIKTEYYSITYFNENK